MELLLLVPMTLLVVVSLYMLYRNFRVYRYRTRIRNLVFDKRPGEPPLAWMDRLKYYETVSYDDMMKKFWKPVNSFYDEERFK